MIISSIDIGTNTILLLIAEADKQTGKIKTLRDELRTPRLGRGLIPDNPIIPEKADLLVKTLAEYKSIISGYNCEKVLLTATNAFRIASNARQLVERVKNELGFEITIVPGKTEAALSYLGAVSSFPGEDKYLVIDIGGGSTEIISGDKNGISFSNSYQMGVVSLTERFFKNQPPDKDEIKRFTDFVKETIDGIDHDKVSAARTIAIAGTPTTLACLKLGLKDYDESLIEGSFLTKEELQEFCGTLSKQTPAEIKLNYGNVMEGREDVILAGTGILHGLMECLKIPEITVSTKGIRYGAILNFLSALVS